MCEKSAQKNSFFCDVAVTAQLYWGQNRYAIVWTVLLNPAELLDEARMWPDIRGFLMLTLHVEVCGCFGAHSGLPHQKTKCKLLMVMHIKESQLRQARWNRRFLDSGCK